MTKDNSQNHLNKLEVCISSFVAKLPQMGFTLPSYNASIIRSNDGMVGVQYDSPQSEDEIGAFLKSIEDLNIEGIEVDKRNNRIFTDNVETFQTMITTYLTHNPDNLKKSRVEKIMTQYMNVIEHLDSNVLGIEEAPLATMQYRRSAYILMKGLENVGYDAFEEEDESEVGDVQLLLDYEENEQGQHFYLGFPKEGNVENYRGLSTLNKLCDTLIDLSEGLEVGISTRDTGEEHLICIQSQNPLEVKNLIARYYYEHQLYGPEDVQITRNESEFKEEREKEFSEIREEYQRCGTVDLNHLPMSPAMSRDDMIAHYQAGINTTTDVSIIEMDAIVRNELGIVPPTLKREYKAFALH